MSLGNYTQWAAAIAEEFQSTLPSEDADALRADLLTMGEAGWEAWAAENQTAVSWFVSSTAAKRAKRKDWANPILRRRLSLAVYHQARLAAAFLNAAEQISPGGSYRETAEYAASLARGVVRRARWIWPFDGDPPWPHWVPDREW